jgi:hypothetical protein
MRSLAAVVVTAAAGAAALLPGSALADSACFGAPTASLVAQRPGPPLRFGISPNVQTGQFVTGPVAPRTPEDPARQIAALRALAPAGTPLVLRLTRLFWSDGQAGIDRYLELAARYTRAGFLVELQLRYHPDASHDGDVAAWTAYVRHVVDSFGPNRRVVGIQVTNEVNFAISPDSSDGTYKNAKDALIEGVIAAKREALARGYRQLKIGFNWVYRSDPSSESSFWTYLRDHGGPSFLQALDWLGLDAYPGTLWPPAEPPGGGRDGMVNALSTLRCYAASAGIPEAVPLYVEENGYPTGVTPDRSYARQAQELEAMVGAVNDFRGTYNVSDYRWFDLRDSNSQSPNFQQQYGLMTDEYVAKPAFGAYRDLIAALSGRR